MKIGWIDKEGKLYEADIVVKKNVHIYIAEQIFPNAENPCHACEKAGYVKFGRLDGKKQVLYGNNMTQAQTNKVDILMEEE